MEIFQIILTSAGSFFVLFLLTKIMGDRQMSQLSMFDYINGITIGSIAAEMATDLENFLKPLLAMIVYALLSVLLAIASNKSMKCRRIIEGKPIILFDNGKLYRKNFKKAKLDINEFLTECRNSGYFDLNNIQSAILEVNGKISFLPKSTQRPMIPQDMNLNPQQEKLVTNIIVDGLILKQNLRFTGNDEEWLKKQLKQQGVNKVSDVFLATCDFNNKISVYIKLNQKMDNNIFS